MYTADSKLIDKEEFLKVPFFLTTILVGSASAIRFTKDESGVYNGRDATNVARAGWFNCYKGGAWMPQVTVHDLLNQYVKSPRCIPLEAPMRRCCSLTHGLTIIINIFFIFDILLSLHLPFL